MRERPDNFYDAKYLTSGFMAFKIIKSYEIGKERDTLIALNAEIGKIPQERKKEELEKEIFKKITLEIESAIVESRKKSLEYLMKIFVDNHAL